MKRRPPGFRWTWLARFEQLESRRLLSGQPDLTITSLTAPASAIEGNAATITVGWTVQNHGTAAAVAPWTDAVYLSSAATLGTDSVQIASLDESLQAPLAPDASYTISHQITVPEFASGDDYLIVRTNDGGSLDEATSTDDLDSRPLKLNPPDVALVVTSATATGPGVDGSVAAGDGQEMNVSWAVQNKGGETAMASWKDAVYLSNDNILDDTDQLLDTQSFAPQAPLASNASYTQYDSIVVPDTAITGDHFLLIVPDADHGQGESSGAGGAFAVPIKITATSDVNLTVTNPTVSTQAVEEGNGQRIDVSYTVTNNGTAPALSAWTDAIYLSSEN